MDERRVMDVPNMLEFFALSGGNNKVAETSGLFVS